MKRRSQWSADVLCYRPGERNQGKVKRHYAKWREENGISFRCDEEACTFHTQPPLWNGKGLPLILDHRNGNRMDNSPENLRLLCPNCDSQLGTRGEANRGRVETATETSYVLRSKDGRRDYHVIPPTERIRIGEEVAAVLISDDTKK